MVGEGDGGERRDETKVESGEGGWAKKYLIHIHLQKPTAWRGKNK